MEETGKVEGGKTGSRDLFQHPSHSFLLTLLKPMPKKLDLRISKMTHRVGEAYPRVRYHLFPYLERTP